MSLKRKVQTQDWIDAAMVRLAEQGPSGVRIDALCHDLGVTKGSFYWHFKGMDDLVMAICTSIEAEFDASLNAASVQDISADDVLQNVLPDWERALDGALRDWAQQNEQIKTLVARLDRRRLGVLGDMLGRAGLDTARLPLLLYAAQLGLDRLDASIGPLPNVTRTALLHMQRERMPLDRAS